MLVEMDGNSIISRPNQLSLDDTLTRYQNWGNTLERLREKKKRAHNAKMEEKEKNQQQLDQQEADIRERNRRAAIDKANRMLFKVERHNHTPPPANNTTPYHFTSPHLTSPHLTSPHLTFTRRKTTG